MTIYHPWESGTDNSPRWTRALERVEVGEIPDYERLDLDHVLDPSERPTGYEYDRFIWLVEVIKDARCDDAVLYRTSPFLAKDVLASAILVRANEALLEIAEVAGAPEEERTRIRAWIERGRKGLEERWDPDLGLCLDYDLRAGEPLAARTIAGFAPLIAGSGDVRPSREASCGSSTRALSRATPTSAGHSLPAPARRRGLPAAELLAGSCLARDELALWWSLESSGRKEKSGPAQGLLPRATSDGCFGEYYEPFTGEALGSDDQSWTAAVALDWLADGEPPLPTL